jgi:hypothetical protein
MHNNSLDSLSWMGIVSCKTQHQHALQIKHKMIRRINSVADMVYFKRNINTQTKANPLTPCHCHTRRQALFARVLCQRLSPTSATSPLSPKQLMHFARMPRTPISPHTALPLCRAKCSDHPSGTRMHSVVRTRVPYPLDILTLTYSADN